MADQAITRDQLAELLNEDLSREYQARLCGLFARGGSKAGETLCY